MEKQYILCAAIWVDNNIVIAHNPKNVPDGIVVAGVRHCNCYSILTKIYPDISYLGKQTEGFLTNRNEFVNREDAANIAYNAGQTKKLLKKLYSEDFI